MGQRGNSSDRISEGRWLVGSLVVAITLAWSLNVVSFLDAKNLALWGGNVVLWAWNTWRGIPAARGFQVMARCWITWGIVVLIGAWVAPAGYYVWVEALRIAGLLLFTSLAYPIIEGEGGEGCLLNVLGVAGAASALLALGQRAGWLPGLFPAFPHYDQSMYSVFGNQGLLGGYLAVALVATIPFLHAAEPRRRWGSRVLAIILFTTLLLTLSRAAVVAAVAGYATLLLLRQTPRRAIPLVAGAGAGIGLVCVLVVGEAGIVRWTGTFGGGDVGGQIRPWIWAATVDVIRDHPLWGTGLGNLGYALPLYLGGHPAPEAVAHLATQTTYHAHNDAMELVTECGFISLLLVFWICSNLRLQRRKAVACVAALAVFSSAHAAWASTPHALAGLLCLATTLKPPATHGHIKPPIIKLFGGFIVVLSSFAYVAGVFYPSVLLRKAEDLHLAGEDAGEAYAQAARMPWASPEALESWGIFCYESGDYRMARELFGQAKGGLDTGRICQLLAMTAVAQGDHEGACTWYQACLRRWPHVEAAQRGVALYCTQP